MTKLILAVVIGAFIVLYFLYKQEKPFNFTPNQEADEDEEDDDAGRPSKPDVL